MKKTRKEKYDVVHKDYKYHIVYKTTNTLNNKIYVGLHSTDNVEDGYLGSGFILKAAIKKYGKANFRRELLAILVDRDEARALEADIVTTEFCARLDTYNLIEGGGGSGDQCGDKNHMWGKKAHNRKQLKATHRNGEVLKAESIRELSEMIGMARGNIRNLIKKQIVGKRGWRVELCKDIV